MFVVFGAVTVVLGLSGEASITPGPLAVWDRWITGWVADAAVALGELPLILQVTLLVALAAMVAIPLWRAIRRGEGELDDRTSGSAAGPEGMKGERDPVCGMRVASGSTSVTWGGDTYRFCAPPCRDRFLESPEEYVPSTAISRQTASGGMSEDITSASRRG